MTKIFISQPRNGKTNEEIEDERNYIISRQLEYVKLSMIALLNIVWILCTRRI